jgi:ATP-binding cassette, subfamily B, bacterial
MLTKAEQPVAGGNGHRRPFTEQDLVRPVNRRRQIGRTPRLATEALRMAWAASPRHLLAVISTQVLASAGIAVQLLIARKILTELIAVSEGGSTSDLYTPLAVFVGVAILVAGMTALGSYFQRLLVELVGQHAFDRIVAVGSSVDYTHLEQPEFYDQLQRAIRSGDFRIIEMVTGLSQLIGALLTTGAIAGVLLFLSPLLLLVVTLGALPALAVAIRNSRANYAFEYAMTHESRERAYMLSLVTTRAAGKEVRLFGLSSHFRQRYRDLTDERLCQMRIFLRQRLRVSLLGGLASAIGLGLALVTLVLMLANDLIGVATGLTAGIAMQQLALRLTAITGNVSRLIEAGMFLDDYHQFLRLAPATPEPDETTAPVAAPPLDRVRLEDVSFTYPGAHQPALDHVDLRVDPGEVVALVGANGSGKTTLVNIVCQLYRRHTGRVLWNGIDAATLAPSAIASDLTVLFQDYLQYHLTAKDNVLLGRVDRPVRTDEVVAAATQAGIHDYLASLPDGFDTRMGLEFHGGHELSGGQWQRLALARAFYRGGRFLILDEPTASLDPRAEAELFSQMRRLAEGRSVLLVSHRFSSARAADRIYVLDGGRVVETGTHDELMAEGGQYAELFTLQARAYLHEGSSSKAGLF